MIVCILGIIAGTVYTDKQTIWRPKVLEAILEIKPDGKIVKIPAHDWEESVGDTASAKITLFFFFGLDFDKKIGSKIDNNRVWGYLPWFL